MLALALSTVLLASPGYVVKADADKVWLDFNEARGAQVGRKFFVYKEGEQLKHPVTGENLGSEEKVLGQGVIEDVREKYSVGKLDAAAAVKAGDRVRLGAAPQPAPLAPTAPAEQGSRGPKWRSDAFDYEATAMAVADLDGDGDNDTALADGKAVFAYAYPPKPAEKTAEYRPQINAFRLYSLEAADLNGNGKAELFATLFNDTFQRFETYVLEQADGKLAKIAEINGVVRAYQDGEGKRVLAVQRVVDDKTFPYSTIYPLVLEDGKYAAGKGAIRPKHVEWVYDFTTANLDGTQPAELTLTGTDLLRVRFPKGSWKSSEGYGQTPLRVRWANRLLSFRPPMLARYQGGRFAGLYIVRNKAALGGLAQPFGLFTGGDLIRKDWNGVGLDDGWRGSLSGYATGMALLPDEVAVTVVGSTGKSAVWAFQP